MPLALLARLAQHAAVLLACAPLFAMAVVRPAAAANSVYVDEMTSPELRQRMAGGSTIVLVPIGGTEQSGPHLALGKHNVRARLLAGRIAEQLGNAVVAPVVSYVPEGSIEPPSAHMRWAGTISVPEAAFEAVLEGAARSFRQHGARAVFFVGDHGGYQKNEERVAARLTREWASNPSCRVVALTAYYQAVQAPFASELRRRGYSAEEIGSHAGLADTSLMLALDPTLVRGDRLGTAGQPGDGVSGDPRRASAALGEIGVQMIVEASVAAIRAPMGASMKMTSSASASIASSPATRRHP